jgi:hypothetical protein
MVDDVRGSVWRILNVVVGPCSYSKLGFIHTYASAVILIIIPMSCLVLWIWHLDVVSLLLKVSLDRLLSFFFFLFFFTSTTLHISAAHRDWISFTTLLWQPPLLNALLEPKPSF